ncbi:MAG: DNA repair protein RecN [Candidatus Kapabacteria bacterium]|nr:DNA repair protein RecN [Candidatus Kapabacteria bacterium]MDW8012642.1 DNA repair protein RecN [Bacteroidota bacterium]
MLCRLFIQDVALFERLELTFGPGLNVITGETGAGKSLLVDSLLLVLGERAGADVVRRGATKGIVEALFRVDPQGPLASFLAEQGYPLEGEELLLRREISSRGTTRCFINDSPAPLSLVRLVGEQLVDFHGQHEQQSLLRVETHGRLLDDAGGLEALRQEYAEAYQRLQQAIAVYRDLQARQHELRERREWLRLRLQEIASIDPKPGEEETLQTELQLSEHAERLYALATQIYGLLYGDDDAVRDRLLRVRNLLEELARIDRRFTEVVTEAQSWIVGVEELARSLQSYSARLDFDPERLEQIRQRMAQFQLLRRRYGSVEEALRQKQKWEEELQLADQVEYYLEQAAQQVERCRRELARSAQRLHNKREDVARWLEREVVSLLAELGIPYSRFVVQLAMEEASPGEELWVELSGRRYRAFSTGIDRVEFLITTNRGEEPRPLVKVASGGEISRIMLALKSILAKSDRLPLLVFDEIDAGISGRIAHRVGQALRALAQYHQVLLITHLPQIAARGTEHIVVEKQERAGRTIVTARRLRPEERAYEIARLVSGEQVTETALQTARELLAVEQ